MSKESQKHIELNLISRNLKNKVGLSRGKLRYSLVINARPLKANICFFWLLEFRLRFLPSFEFDIQKIRKRGGS